MVFELLWVL